MMLTENTPKDYYLNIDHYRHKAYEKLKAKCAELNNGWIPDWMDHQEYKYFIVYDHEYNMFMWDDTQTVQMNGMFYVSRVFDAQRLIQENLIDLQIYHGVI